MNLDVHKDFNVVVVSFDHRETPAQAARRKASYVERYNRPGSEAGWHFLTGSKESIAALTGAAGFRFVWDEDTKQFAHPTGIIVTTPGGKPARYLFGLEYGPRDVRLALVEASRTSPPAAHCAIGRPQGAWYSARSSCRTRSSSAAIPNR
jgi:protein SCO1/2